jgi:hypothetical protein
VRARLTRKNWRRDAEIVGAAVACNAILVLMGIPFWWEGVVIWATACVAWTLVRVLLGEDR